MVNFNSSQSVPFSDPKAELFWKYDAIHGYIDTRDEYKLGEENVIQKLLKSRVLQRLRKVKQLGFASMSYTSADHNRFSHALGTMHMMRILFNHLIQHESFPIDIVDEVNSYFKISTRLDKSIELKIILQHMLVVALIQDSGELPYLQSTRHIFKPNHELKRTIENSIGFPLNGLSNKSVFSIGCLFYQDIISVLKGYSLPFIIWLLTGETNAKLKPDSSIFLLRHLIDGVVDADRLDYVYRDAYSSTGNYSKPIEVVESLLYYDKVGPVFNDPSAVSSFLATRAHLYSSVYLDSTNRFYALLLVNFLKGVLNNQECNQIFFNNQLDGELSIEDFLELDDISLFSRINRFALDKNVRKLSEKARLALDILTGKDIDYTSFWLPKPKKQNRKKEILRLPDELFFDTFKDQKRFLYQEGHVRIKSNKYNKIGETIALEECGGPFNAIFKEKLLILPMLDQIMIYLPKKIPPKESWQDFNNMLEIGSLYNHLINNDPLTNENPFANNPEIKKAINRYDVFLCYNSKDKTKVKRIGNQLKNRGIIPWLDEWQIPPGSHWHIEIQSQINNIKSAVIFIGEDGTGPWQEIEIGLLLMEFVKRGCPVIPAILKGCNSNPELPAFLGAVAYVDFNVKTPNPIDSLIWGIKGRRQ